MQDTEFYERLLGLSKPSQVDGVQMDMTAGEVLVTVSCQSTVWGGADGRRLHIHGYEQRRWRHLDTCQFRTIIEARVPRVLDPGTGKTQMVGVPWAVPGLQRFGAALAADRPSLGTQGTLQCFWQQGQAAQARSFFAKWWQRVNYFLHPITNAMSEGLNSRIQLLKSSARGFRNFAHYRTRILFFMGKLDLLPPLSSSHGS